MLLFEFEAALFQFEQRDPELDVLFQLPPNRAALIPGMPFAFQPRDPSTQNFPHL